MKIDAMKIYFWNENCSRAGQLVSEDAVAEYEASGESANECGDWSQTYGTPAQLIEYSESIESGNANLYSRRLADAIRERVYFYHPELEPAEAE